MEIKDLKELPAPALLAAIALYGMVSGAIPYITLFAIAGLVLIATAKIARNGR